MFKSLIKNKKVIFVGPSPYLGDLGKGEFFDSFDTVIRTNGAFPVQEHLISDYGKKCDILYFNMSYAKLMNPLPVQLFKDDGLKHMVFKSEKRSTILKYNKIIPSRTLDGNSRKGIRNHGTGIVMGCLLLNDILQFEPSVFYIAGIDFYNDLGKQYFSGYQPKKILDAVTNRKLKEVELKRAFEEFKELSGEFAGELSGGLSGEILVSPKPPTERKQVHDFNINKVLMKKIIDENRNVIVLDKEVEEYYNLERNKINDLQKNVR